MDSGAAVNSPCENFDDVERLEGLSSGERSPVSVSPRSPNEKASRSRVVNKPDEQHGTLRAIISIWNRMTERRNREPKTQWHTTWKRYGPLLGLGCIASAVGSIFASLAVLLVSDGKQATWQYQPAAYLAVFTAIANQSMRFASLQGVAIAWWGGALHERGTTLAALHHDWDMGINIWSALTAGRRTNLLAIACMMSTFVAIDGPLLQQSSKAVSAMIPENEATSVSLMFELPSELPSGYTGSFLPAALPGWLTTLPVDNPVTTSIGFSSGPLRDHVLNATVTAKVAGCIESCRAIVRAPALSIKSCEYFSPPANYTSVKPDGWPVSNTGWTMSMVEPFDFPYKHLFYTSVTWTLEDKEYINVTAFSASIDDEQTCSGTANYTSCVLESAIGQYELVLTNNTEVDDPKALMNSTITLPQSVAYVPILQVANNTRYSNDPQSVSEAGMVDSTLAGFPAALFPNMVRYLYENRTHNYSYTSSTLISGNPAIILGHSRGDDCMSYSDPFENLLDQLNRMMFRSSITSLEQWKRNMNGSTENFTHLLDPGQSIYQTVPGYKHGTWNAYETNLTWFYGATAVEILCILLILPTYWGWWKIGRAVSFSPLEIAKAFDAPLLADCNSNLRAEDLAKATEGRMVRYGATGRLDEEGVQPLLAEKLTFAKKEEVYRPLDTFDFEK